MERHDFERYDGVTTAGGWGYLYGEVRDLSNDTNGVERQKGDA